MSRNVNVDWSPNELFRYERYPIHLRSEFSNSSQVISVADRALYGTLISKSVQMTRKYLSTENLNMLLEIDSRVHRIIEI